METEVQSIKLEEVFFTSLVRQVRATDAYGAWEKFTDQELLEKKFLKPEGSSGVKDTAGFNVRLYLQAAAVTLELLSGKIIGLITESGCDGSVRAMFYTGHFIVLEKTFGSIDGFYFGNVEKLINSGVKLAERMHAIINQNKESYNDLMG